MFALGTPFYQHWIKGQITWMKTLKQWTCITVRQQIAEPTTAFNGQQ